jgi:hypothetical protein
MFTIVYKWNVKYVPFLFNRIRADGNELNDINKTITVKKKKNKKKINQNTPLTPENTKLIQPMFKVNVRKFTNELL